MKKNNLILAIVFLSAILLTTTGYGQTIAIGSQIWTTKNLNVSTYRNGDVIPQVQDEKAWAKLTTGAWCYYKNDASNGTKYGKLYNWYAVHDPRGLAPKGYLIPTDEEWTKLADYLGGGSEAGKKMKSTSGWENGGNGTNSSGLSVLPGGYRANYGAFEGIGYDGCWWSSTEANTANAWFRGLNYSNGDFYRDNDFKKSGFSVRCLGSIESSGTGVVVTIGSQVWTTKNLDVSTYRNGDVIPQVQDEKAWAELTTGAWCYYNNDASNGTKYGKLYNWYAVHDPRGLAPKGYHIPTDEEWTKLADYLGGDEGEAGTKMKSTSGWKNNGNGTNSSGFSGLPGGNRYEIGSIDGVLRVGSFGSVLIEGDWWSFTEHNANKAECRNLVFLGAIVFSSSEHKKSGCSVRCLRD